MVAQNARSKEEDDKQGHCLELFNNSSIVVMFNNSGIQNKLAELRICVRGVFRKYLRNYLVIFLNMGRGGLLHPKTKVNKISSFADSIFTIVFFCEFNSFKLSRTAQ